MNRFLRFCAVGFSGVFVNEGVLKVLTDVFGLYYLYASCFAVEFAIISNFLLNEYWTFGDRSSQQPGLMHRFQRFLKFNLICALGAVLNIATLWVLTELVEIHYLLSNLAGIGVATLWNFGMNSRITWETSVAD
jgi:dolichol-phosphate mannosyltransferase